MSKKLPKVRDKIFIGIPLKPIEDYPTHESIKTRNSLNMAIQEFLRKHPEVDIVEPYYSRHGDTVEARTQIVNNMRGSHLFMIDGDQEISSETLWKLYEADKDIILGCSVRKKPPWEPTWGYFQKNGKLRPGVYKYDYDGEDIINDRILEVDAGGFPCIMIKREVFDEINPHLYGPAFNRIAHFNFPNTHYGHDLSFCMRARAAGMKVYVHLGVKVKHKTIDGWAWLNWHFSQLESNYQVQQYFNPIIAEENLVLRSIQRENEALSEAKRGGDE